MPTYIDTTNLSPATISTLQGPIITQIQITTSAYVVKDDTAVSTSGGYIKITGANFTAGTQVVIGTAAASSVTYVNSTTLNVQVPAQAAGTYVVYVTTNTGSVAILVNGLTYSGDPVWVTGSTLTGGQVDTAISIQLSATGDAPVTYALQAGSSLPPGVTLSSGGLLSGTVTGITSETVYNFTIEAIDGQLQESPRTFSITISANDQYFEYVTSLLSAATPTSTFVTDASTNGFAVTVNGDTRPSNFGPYTPGYYSAYFDGTGDYLTAGSSVSLSSDFTVEGWVYGVSYGSNGFYLYGLGNDINSSGATFFISTSGYLRIFTNNANLLSGTSATLTLNTWNHVAFVRNSGTVRAYLNGVQVDSASWSGTITGLSHINAELNGSPTATTYVGGACYISNQRVVTSAVYTSAFTPSTTPLTAVANTQLLTCQSNRFIDNSTNNYTITRNGDTAISGFDPFVPSSSFAGYGSGFFDGTGDYLSATGTALNLVSGDFTIEAWIYLVSGSTYQFIIGSSDNSSGFMMIGLNVPLSPTSTIAIGRSGLNWPVQFGSSITFVSNTWHHIAITRSGTTNRAFINGVQLGSNVTDSTSWSFPSNTMWIGSQSGGTAFNGYMTDIRIVKGTAVYTTNFTPPTTPLTAIANTSLLTLQNNQPTNNNMFLDSSTNNFTIARNGNTTQGTFSPYGGGWSNYFGTTQFKLSTTGMTALGSDFTLEVWIYPTSFNDYNTIFDNRTSDGDANGLVLGLTSAAKVYFYTNAAFQITTATSISLNTWTHIALVRSGAGSGNVKIYINGVADANTATYTTSFTRTAPSIGDDWSTRSNLQYYGYLSNLRATTSALYTSSFTPSTSPLTAISGTVLLTCQSNRFIDNSFSALAMTVTGSPTVQRFNPFNPVTTTPTSYSGYFDGTGDWLSGIGTASSFNFMHNTSALFTIEAWVYTGTTGAQQTIACTNGTAASASVGFWFAIETDNTLRLFVTKGSAGNPVINTFSSGSVPLNSWTHVAVTYNQSLASNNATFYINGVLSGTGTKTANAPVDSNAGNALNVGSFQGGGAYMVGYISNLRITNSIVYTGAFTPSTSPLTAIANTSLLTLQSPTFIDNSTNNFTITNNGDTAPRQFNPFGWTSTTGSGAAYTPALYGGSAYFDGTGDYLSLASNAAYGFGTGDFTIEYFVYPTVLSGTKQVLDMRAGSSNVSLIDFYLEGTTLRFLTNLSVRIDSNTALVPNAWTHCALVRSSGVTRMYVNGVQQTTTYTDSTNYATTSVVLGASNDGSFNNNYVGYLSDVRLTKGTARYTSNFQPPIAPLTALQNTVLLNNMTGAGIYDSSMMSNYETVGNSSISTSVKKYGNTSMYFDGTGDYLVCGPVPANYVFGTGDFTMEMWIYASTVSPSYQGIWDSRTADPSVTPHITLASGAPTWWVSGAARITGSTLVANTWYHLAVVRSSGVTKMYLNGTQTGSNYTDSNNYTSRASPTIGINFDILYPFTGYLDDLRITNGIARYTTTFTPPTSPYIRF